MHWSNLLLIDQKQLILANLFRSELVGRLAKVMAKLVDVIRVGVNGGVGQVPQLHITDHALDEGVHSFLVGCHGFCSEEMEVEMKDATAERTRPRCSHRGVKTTMDCEHA
jgi:hypothetical protein